MDGTKADVITSGATTVASIIIPQATLFRGMMHRLVPKDRDVLHMHTLPIECNVATFSRKCRTLPYGDTWQRFDSRESDE